MSVHLALRGEVDLVSGPEIQARIESLCAQGLDVVVDLAEVTFLDSSGMRALVDASRAAARTGCRVEIGRGPPEVMRVFDLAGLTEYLPFLSEAPGPRVLPDWGT